MLDSVTAAAANAQVADTTSEILVEEYEGNLTLKEQQCARYFCHVRSELGHTQKLTHTHRGCLAYPSVGMSHTSSVLTRMI